MNASSLDRRWALGRLLALAACLGAGIALWDRPFVYPFKLLAVMMHESGHALASLGLGGSVDKVILGSDESGLCLSHIPRSLLGEVVVSSAGYLGNLVAGSLLVLLTLRFRWRRAVLWATTAWLLFMGVFYAGNAFTLLFCLGTAAALGLCARFLPAWGCELLTLFLSAFSALYAVLDLRDDLWTGAAREHSDAGILARATHVPAVVWAALWTAAAVAWVLLVLRWAFRTAGRPQPAHGLPQVPGWRAKSMSARR